MYIEHLYLNILPVTYLAFAFRFAFGPLSEMSNWKRNGSVTWAISFFTFWAWFISSCTLVVLLDRFTGQELNWVVVGIIASLSSLVPTFLMHTDPATWRYARAAATFPEPPHPYTKNPDGVWRR